MRKTASPLFNQKILITRPSRQSPVLQQTLARKGARVVSVPLVAIRPVRDARASHYLKRIGEYDWIVFSSANGVDFFFKNLRGRKMTSTRTRFAVIGKKTARALAAKGSRARLVPGEFVQEDLARALLEQIGGGSAKVLLVGSKQGRTVLSRRLRAAGCRVDRWTVYETRPLFSSHRRVRRLIDERKCDAVLFTSSSAVESFREAVKGLRKKLEGVVIGAIGPVTADTAAKAGFPASAVARESTVEGLVKALETFYKKRYDFHR